MHGEEQAGRQQRVSRREPERYPGEAEGLRKGVGEADEDDEEADVEPGGYYGVLPGVESADEQQLDRIPRQPAGERDENGRHQPGVPGSEFAALVEQTHQRSGQRDQKDERRNDREARNAQPERKRGLVTGRVVSGVLFGEFGDQGGRYRDGEDAVGEQEDDKSVVELVHHPSKREAKRFATTCTPTVAATKTSTGAASFSAAPRAGCPNWSRGL